MALRPDLSIVILSWNTRALTLSCLAALRADPSPLRREIIVVDNGSEDGSADAVARDYPEAILIRNTENRLYAAGNNQGARYATGEYLCLLNSDTEVRPGALDRLHGFLRTHPAYGAAGPQLLWPTGEVQPACTRLPLVINPLFDATVFGSCPPGKWYADWMRMKDFDHMSSRDVDQPPGACFMMARREYLDMGGFDEALSLYFNDVDLCYRLRRAGRKIRYLAEAKVVHHGGQSTARLDRNRVGVLWWRNGHAFYAKHWGRTGAAWHRLVLFLWAAELAGRYHLGPKTVEERRQAMAELRDHLRACLA